MKLIRIVLGITIGSLIGYYIGAYYESAQLGLYIGGGLGLLMGSCNLIFGRTKKTVEH